MSEQEQADFPLPDVNTPEVREAIQKQENSGPPLLGFQCFGKIHVRLTKVSRTRPGKKPHIILSTVVIDSPFEDHPEGSDMGLLLPLGPGPYEGIEYQRAALLASLVRVIFKVPKDEKVDMGKLEALIKQGRLPDAVSQSCQFIVDRRKDGQPKPFWDKKNKCQGEGLRQYHKDFILPPPSES
jgi:hypothetical protein